MLAPMLLMSLAATVADLSDGDARCSYLVRFGGPDPETMYVHAVATGERQTVSPDADAQSWLGRFSGGEGLPDSVVAFELRVERAAGGTVELSPGDLILVTPWAYRPDCSPVRWRDEWIEPGEETLLTLAGGRTVGDTFHFDIRGSHYAYPQGGGHRTRGEARSTSGPPWMSVGEFFDLLIVLPPAGEFFEPLMPLLPLEGERWRIDAYYERVIEVIESGPNEWEWTYPASRILREARGMADPSRPR
jgi:hypothetical protein